MPNYTRLGRGERQVIYVMSKAKMSQTEIARTLGVSQGTISKELSRNRGNRGYRPKQAQEKAAKRQQAKRVRESVLIGELKDIVIERLRLKHSPEQISGALGGVVSHESIYRLIREDKKAGGDLYKHLRINHKRRYRKGLKEAGRSKIKGRVGIEERPEVVNERKRYGDWEVDLIEGCKGSGFILSLFERKSRLGKLHYLKNKGAQETAAAIIDKLKGLKVRTLTYDNGLEFSEHEQVSAALGAKGYFCRPYHSWEKGAVENYNGLVRQYFPKGSSFAGITQKQLREVEEEINQRPRKVLGFYPPSELEDKLAA